ncbi:hypothetical protein NNJEOMEG_01899 [Fundidesulfovibrio magnetotacticus]|uniref:Probable membrane transporter protein n=1 Tax=Fundidesulfovibrio magnetotacticus TaxID=2730080 RepID=A0A6V8LSX5_9BACT|nr:hypothetical protein NNJEOMEG_01899 [Fundidesulfovibrio magnetotacticus]
MSRKRAIVAMVMLCLVMASYYVPFGQAQDKAADPAQAPAAAAAPAAGSITLNVDKTALKNGGDIKVTGKAPAGKGVYLEVWNDNKVRSVFFDSAKPNPETPPPYKLYLTEGLPAFYQIYLPKDKAEALSKVAGSGPKFQYSVVLKELGADVAYNVPAKVAIDAFQSTIMASILGSRGEPLPKLDAQETKRRSMQLVKARFRSKGKLLAATVDVAPDGAFSAVVKIPDGSAPGKYNIVAYADKEKSAPAVVENSIAFPVLYMENAGTSMNVFWPFLLTLAIGVFGVLMGAGGGFLLNPILLSIWPVLPHTVVAGTVTPTVLFSQGSGIYNYSKIKFISWKLGVIMGLAMAAGGFIGPKLTELITLDQFKFVFGWILLVLGALMFWQTTPGYLEKNKKEQAILKEFKKRAEENAKAKA